ncbi:MAG: 30S ribosomal protein S17 [Holosporales bacterium]|jgi:small subunit ribosomal protein S17|nr:30S ribosomal protein S17 [Holosporales bacterium]
MPRRILIGTVKGNKNDKTVTVSIVRHVVHPKYKKSVSRRVTYHAHDPRNACEIGQKVTIRECPPVSKLKHWEVLYEEGDVDLGEKSA